MHYTRWGNGLRYIRNPEYATNILNDALIKAKQDLKGGSESYRESYRHFVERGIKVIKQILTQYGLEETSLDKSRGPGPSVKTGGSLPDKLLGEKGERLIYERERQYVIKQGFDPDKVSWAAQAIPNLPYDIETVRRTPNGSRPHLIEVKSTTLEDLTNIYVSQQQIDHMKANRDASKLIILLFGSDGEKQKELEFSVDDLLDNFEFLPIKFKLKPLPSVLHGEVPAAARP
jgi:Domain of unknown function (DUF3883)